MNVIIRKRQIIMSALVIALGSAVFVNWYFTRPEAAKVQGLVGAEVTGVSYSTVGDAQYVSSNTDGVTIENSDFMAESKLARSKAHDEAFEKLNDVIKSSSSSQSAVDSATKQLAELTNVIKLEADVEALVKAKCGFECVVLINSGNAEVACEKGSLNSTSILQIKEILLKHTEISAENITIFETK